MSRPRLAVLLPPLVLGFVTLSAQMLLLRRFLWQVEATELGVGLFLASWLAWVGLGAGLACTRSGSRVVDFLVTRLPAVLLLYLPLFCLQVWLIAHARQLVGVSASAATPIGHLLLGALIANAPVSLATSFIFPAAARWLSARGGSAALTYALDAAGGVAACLLITLLLMVGVPVDGGASRAEWRRLFPATQPDGAFATSSATYLHGWHGGSLYTVSAGRVVDVLPEREQATDVAAVLLARAPNTRRILLLGHTPLAVAMALAEFQPHARVTWCHDDPDYARRLLALARQRLGAELPAGVVVSPLSPQRLLASSNVAGSSNRFDLVAIWPSSFSAAAGAAMLEPAFLRRVAAVSEPGGVVALPLGGSGGGAWSPEQRLLGAAVLAHARRVWPERGMLAPGAGGWWLTGGRAGEPAPDIAMLTQQFVGLGVARVPAAVIGELYEPGRAAELLQACTAADAHSGGTRHGIQRLGLLRDLHAEWPAWPLARLADAWMNRAGAMLLLLVLLAVGLAPAVCGARVAAPRRVILAWLAAGSFLGLTGLLALMRALEMRVGGLYLLAGLASSLYLAGLYAGNRLPACVQQHWRGNGWLSATTSAQVAVTACLVWLAGAQASPRLLLGACLVAGVAAGACVPVALAAWTTSGVLGRHAGAWLTMGDAWGSALGGVVASLVFLPWLGGIATVLAVSGMAMVLACLAVAGRAFARLLARGVLALALGAGAIVCTNHLGSPVRATAPASVSVAPSPAAAWTGPVLPINRAAQAAPATANAVSDDETPPSGHARAVDLPRLKQLQARGGLATNEASWWETERP